MLITNLSRTVYWIQFSAHSARELSSYGTIECEWEPALNQHIQRADAAGRLTLGGVESKPITRKERLKELRAEYLQLAGKKEPKGYSLKRLETAVAKLRGEACLSE